MNPTENFSISEFDCPCCQTNFMQDSFISALQVARDYLGRPIHVNSGFRCPVHNGRVGGVSESSHMAGLASDLHCNHSQSRYLLIGSLLRAGFNRIGIYKYFIHVDRDPTKPPGVIWAGRDL